MSRGTNKKPCPPLTLATNLDWYAVIWKPSKIQNMTKIINDQKWPINYTIDLLILAIKFIFEGQRQAFLLATENLLIKVAE